jgi:hypothetical protein
MRPKKKNEQLIHATSSTPPAFFWAGRRAVDTCGHLHARTHMHIYMHV